MNWVGQAFSQWNLGCGELTQMEQQMQTPKSHSAEIVWRSYYYSHNALHPWRDLLDPIFLIQISLLVSSSEIKLQQTLQAFHYTFKIRKAFLVANFPLPPSPPTGHRDTSVLPPLGRNLMAPLETSSTMPANVEIAGRWGVMSQRFPFVKLDDTSRYS